MPGDRTGNVQENEAALHSPEVTVGLRVLDKDDGMGIKINPRHNEPIAGALRRLKRILQKEGQQRDLMRHRYYETKSQRRRRKRAKNARKARKKTP